MDKERSLRLAVFIAVALIHGLIIFFWAFKVRSDSMSEPENARVMKVTDLAEMLPPPELPPPPPPPPPPRTPPRENRVSTSIAETMIETETPPPEPAESPPASFGDEYLPMHKISTRPGFNQEEIAAAIEYPAIARRSGIEGRVILELFVDRTGIVQQVRVVQENPPGRGFGEAAIKAFSGRRLSPARANGEAVSCRFRWPVTFKLN
jgi:protein TonB